MTKTSALALAFLLTMVAAAAAYQYPMIPFSSGLGPMAPGLNGPMMPNSIGAYVPPPPNPCSGAADFSDGCAPSIF